MEMFSFDDILKKIADYFGVSFEACVRRIAYKIHAVEGDIENKELKKRIRRYHPDKKGKNMECHMRIFIRIY